MTTYELKRGDVGSSVTETLLKGDGSPVNLVGASVRFLAEAKDRRIGGEGVVLENGQVRYTFTDENLDVPVTTLYLAEWEVTYAGGEKETFPQSGYVRLIVWADLDEADESP
jgi:hypothetical protein